MNIDIHMNIDEDLRARIERSTGQTDPRAICEFIERAISNELSAMGRSGARENGNGFTVLVQKIEKLEKGQLAVARLIDASASLLTRVCLERAKHIGR